MSKQELNRQQAEFQEYTRNWLAENAPAPSETRLPLSVIEVMQEAHRDYLQAWQLACYEAGLVGCDVPS